MSLTVSLTSDSSEVSVNIAVITVKFPNFYRTFLFSWLDFFLPAGYNSFSFIRKANCRFLTRWCIFICSSFFSLFWTGPWSFCGPSLLITWQNYTQHKKCLVVRTTMLINWVANVWHSNPGNSHKNRLGWLHTHYRAVNQEGNFNFQWKRKTGISPPIFSLF